MFQVGLILDRFRDHTSSDKLQTSLARALSTELSTAALDKHPQSQERGITLDLGFSAFMAELPERFKGSSETMPRAICPCSLNVVFISRVTIWEDSSR